MLLTLIFNRQGYTSVSGFHRTVTNKRTTTPHITLGVEETGFLASYPLAAPAS